MSSISFSCLWPFSSEMRLISLSKTGLNALRSIISSPIEKLAPEGAAYDLLRLSFDSRAAPILSTGMPGSLDTSFMKTMMEASDAEAMILSLESSSAKAWENTKLYFGQTIAKNSSNPSPLNLYRECSLYSSTVSRFQMYENPNGAILVREGSVCVVSCRVAEWGGSVPEDRWGNRYLTM